MAILHRPTNSELESTFNKGKSLLTPEKLAFSKLDLREDDYFIKGNLKRFSKNELNVIILPRTDSGIFDYKKIYTNSDTELLKELKDLIEKDFNEIENIKIGKYFLGELTNNNRRYSDRSYVIVTERSLDKEKLNSLILKLKDLLKVDFLLTNIETSNELKFH